MVGVNDEQKISTMSMSMSTTIVFACKSNSCRSQMAEAWANEWIKSERLGLENKTSCRKKLSAFLDGLTVVSVALDESSVARKSKTNADASSSSRNQCVTCAGEEIICSSSPRSSTTNLRKPKEKAIQAMAEDGVDISSYVSKTVSDILPFIVNKQKNNLQQLELTNTNINNNCSAYGSRYYYWKQCLLSFTGMVRVLEMASREMGMAFAGVVAQEEDNKEEGEEDANTTKTKSATTHAEEQVVEEVVVVDSLIVLCSCPDSMKRRLSDLSKQTLDWDDIEPPTAAAKSGEGDGAYLRVSRQIRDRVYKFLDELKECAMMLVVDGKDNMMMPATSDDCLLKSSSVSADCLDGNGKNNNCDHRNNLMGVPLSVPS